MKNDLRVLREEHGVTSKEIISYVQNHYPRFDKTLLSKCVGDGYGVQLDPTIVKELYQHFAPKAAKRKEDAHRWKDRITCRFAPDEYKALTEMAESNGITIQECVRTLIRSAMIANQYLEVKGADE